MQQGIDAYKAVLVALRQILKVTGSQSRQLARDTGITTSQFVSLQTIANSGQMSAGELARALNLTQATVTAIITRLEECGLIVRCRNESDRRRVIISLTADGEALLGAAPALLQARLQTRFESLEPWEQTQILATLQRLAALMGADEIDAAPVLEIGNLQQDPSS